MPRPFKRRRVCSLPDNNKFGPLNLNHSKETIMMSVDEFETIRLIDYENFTQEECALQMKVARTTVQSIYFEARKKLADSIVNGKELLITGGEYQLCNDEELGCGRGCRRRMKERGNKHKNCDC